MIKFLMMCCLMVCAVMASEQEWVEAEIVGRKLALVRCVGNQPESFVRDDLVQDLEELRGCVKRLLDCKKTLTISLAGELCGVDDGAIARIEALFGRYERMGKGWQPLFMNSLRNFNYCRRQIEEQDNALQFKSHLQSIFESMCYAASQFKERLKQLRSR